jgi:hypothetical protein
MANEEELEKICQKIIKLDPKMRSARIINRREFDSEFGPVHFSMSYRDKVIVMSFPLANDDVLLISSEKELDFGKVPFAILKIIKPLKDLMKTF